MYTRLTAAEAAALIKNGDHIAMSGFTPDGVAKATTKELEKSLWLSTRPAASSR